ncbi:MAG: tRNA lysidine(34) synthetase TilS [Beijerinckiaceae bacterium]
MAKVSQPDPQAFFAPHFSNATGIVVAVSGGPDSMALLHMLAQWKKHPRLEVATVDHGLRADSAIEAEKVAAYARGLGLNHTTLHWRGAKPAAGIQEAAREARYRLLCLHALETGCSHMVTAHHADDQAETVLQRLLAGSGIAGLSGMDVMVIRDFAKHFRPLLAVPKAALVEYCAQNNVPFVTDPSNTDSRYGRTRMRTLMAMLADDGLTSQRLCKLAERANRADLALDESAGLALMSAVISPVQSGPALIDWNKVSKHAAEIRLRILMLKLEETRSNSEPMRLERLEALEAQLSSAHRTGTTLRRSIADRIVSLDRKGVLSITAAPPRKRGVT